MNRPQEVKLHFLDYWRIIRIRLGLIFLIFVVVLGTAAVITYFMPREYSSFATIELRPDMTPVRIFENQPATSDNRGFDPPLVGTFRTSARYGRHIDMRQAPDSQVTSGYGARKFSGEPGLRPGRITPQRPVRSSA